MPHVLTNSENSRFYSLSGWLSHKEQAMRFRNAADALDYGKREGLIGAVALSVPEPADAAAAVLPDAGKSIFGFGNRPVG